MSELTSTLVVVSLIGMLISGLFCYWLHDSRIDGTIFWVILPALLVGGGISLATESSLPIFGCLVSAFIGSYLGRALK
jgi:hypothetical protein